MGTPDLDTRQLTFAAAAVLGLTALAAAAGLLEPGLAGRTRPHPTLTGSIDEALSIWQNNLRVLATPFLLCLLGFPASRLARHTGDILVTGLAAASVIPVGVELGRWRSQLLPYLPQLPLEWVALTAALAAWLVAREGGAPVRELALLASAVAVLLAGAASLETWCTPHRRTPDAVRDASADSGVHAPSFVAAGGCLRPGFCAPDGPIAARSLTPFPFAVLGSARPSRCADRATSTHRPPQGGIT